MNNNKSKIYSRKRLDFFSKKNNRIKPKKIRKKIIFILIILIIAFCTFYMIWNAVNPIFDTICEDKAKSIATKITNEESTNVMARHNYDELFSIEKDNDGNIQMISSNILRINEITSDIALEIQKSLNKSEENYVKLSMRNN